MIDQNVFEESVLQSTISFVKYNQCPKVQFVSPVQTKCIRRNTSDETQKNQRNILINLTASCKSFEGEESHPSTRKKWTTCALFLRYTKAYQSIPARTVSYKGSHTDCTKTNQRQVHKHESTARTRIVQSAQVPVSFLGKSTPFETQNSTFPRRHSGRHPLDSRRPPPDEPGSNRLRAILRNRQIWQRFPLRRVGSTRTRHGRGTRSHRLRRHSRLLEPRRPGTTLLHRPRLHALRAVFRDCSIRLRGHRLPDPRHRKRCRTQPVPPIRRRYRKHPQRLGPRTQPPAPPRLRLYRILQRIRPRDSAIVCIHIGQVNNIVSCCIC